MKVHEIAKLTGQSSAEVAEALGLPTGQGVAFTNVDDDKALEYVKARGGARTAEGASEPLPKSEARPTRFWSPTRGLLLAGNAAKGVKEIQFQDWIATCPSDSAEAALLRSDYVRDALTVREVIEKPYDDPGKVADFIGYLETLIYTGQTRQDGPSREGRDCVRAILPADVVSKLDSVAKSSPRTLARAVAGAVSFNVLGFVAEEQ